VDASAIIGAVQGVTKKWAKQRKAEERRASAAARRRYAMTHHSRITLKTVVYDHLPAAYNAVSDNGQLPAGARQTMYEVRRRIQADTDDELNDCYFTQTLLPQFMAEHRQITQDWDVVFDARGHFTEPHTESEVSLGTLDVRRYLREKPASGDVEFSPKELYPTHGPEHRFGAILFIEKEGFIPLFEKVKLAERYDIAMMSTKGLSNTAARQLVDQLCGEHDIPLMVLVDFDKARFSIRGTLKRSTDRYEFQNHVRMIDLGLRLIDVEEWNLESECFYTKASTSAMKQNLRYNGATDEEVAFIAENRKRVELNAFRSADLISFIEAKLAQHKIKKVVPDAPTMEAAYRRALRIEYLKNRFEELQADADAYVDEAKVPTLARKVQARLKKDASLSWDRVVADLAADAIDDNPPE